MKTIGLIGGMSWESSIEYYRQINVLTKQKWGKSHSAKSIMYSVDFEGIKNWQYEGNWDALTKAMVAASQAVEAGGADFIILCTNTMHKSADTIQANIGIPLVHIADPTAEKIISKGFKKVGLLGTRFTMEEGFYKDRLLKKFGIEAIVPVHKDIACVHTIIYEELVMGKILEESKREYLRIIKELISSGAEGIILGCTEIGLLIKQEDVEVPVFDTAFLHAFKAVELAAV